MYFSSSCVLCLMSFPPQLLFKSEFMAEKNINLKWDISSLMVNDIPAWTLSSSSSSSSSSSIPVPSTFSLHYTTTTTTTTTTFHHSFVSHLHHLLSLLLCFIHFSLSLSLSSPLSFTPPAFSHFYLSYIHLKL